ncbi:ribonuclease E activity regulator RraA [uncultured Abyssibacter sp.]|uniref:ribonuclease E activity regulator RraA n=1 Tax=uncultured Abyssibacter sp. TaxID=2320202 RepID=UPI0032B28902
MSYAVTDLCDAHSDKIQVAEPIFADFGGVLAFSGAIHTLKCFEDNTFVRSELEQPGEGRVLVVDGGGSLRCALLGGNLAKLAEDNGWSGVVVYGCVRDCEEIEDCSIGVKAMAAHPLKSRKQNVGEVGVPLRFAGIEFREGDYLYADVDGLITAGEALEP